MRTTDHLLALPEEQKKENARKGGKVSGNMHSVEHMAKLGRRGGKAKKPGLQNNKFTSEQAREAQLKAAAARKGKKYKPRKAKNTNMWGVPTRKK